ncbi:hypothetical protein PROFUN_13186 [Planoprotostelium fungivorum]|uniref:Uncharacterized protein n=1 Tax=Planoprotostelium fungivorum TaxID=1890364 RepID=A0A2P6N4Z8_9EUKA|nr:hypothetical protein PROFUN_13186 [Planoprotostelium fungivorum]
MPHKTRTRTFDEKARLCRALQGRQYEAPNIPAPLSPPTLSKTKVTHISPDGYIYDQYYCHVPEAQAFLPTDVKEKTESVNESLDLLFAEHGLDLRSALFVPSPESFEKFTDYERALLEWCAQTEETLNSERVKLPRASSRHYFRPRITDKPKNESNSVPTNNVSRSLGASTKKKNLGPDPKLIEQATELVKNRVVQDEISVENLSKLLDKNANNEQELNTIHLAHPPWDSSLLPTEPDPSIYNTFEEYEYAMQNWARICCEVSVVPPHASQLKELIPITQYTETIDTDSASSTSESEEEVVVRGNHNPLLIRSYVPEPIVPRKIPGGRSVIGEISTRSTRRMSATPPMLKTAVPIMPAFERLTKVNAGLPRVSSMGNVSRNVDHQLLPVIHGVYKRSQDKGEGPKISRQHKALRRTDLNGRTLMSCMDAPTEIYGKPVEAYQHDFDVEKPNLLKELRVKSTRDSIHSKIRQLQVMPHHKFEAWYHPKTPPEVIREAAEQLEGMFDGQEKLEVDIDFLDQLVQSKMFLDKFEEMMTRGIVPSNGVATYHQYIVNNFNPGNFVEFLHLYNVRKAPEVRAKISLLVSFALQSHRSQLLLDSIAQDASSLCNLAQAMNFFNDVSYDIMPYCNDKITYFTQKYGKEYRNILERILCYYYLRIILSIISKRPYAYVSLPPNIQNAIRVCTQPLIALLQQFPDFIRRVIWSACTTSSMHFSTWSLFIVIQLMKDSYAPLAEYLRSDECGFYNSFSCLFCKKCSVRNRFSHVQFVTKRIFDQFHSGSWRVWMLAKHTPESIVEGLKSDRKDGNIWVPSLQANLTRDLVIDTLNKKDGMNFLYEDKILEDMINHLTANSSRLDDRSTLMTDVLAHVTKARCQQLSARIRDVKSKKPEGLDVPKQITKIVNFIKEGQRTDLNIANLYVDKRNMIYALKQFIKSPESQDLLKKDTDLIPKLITFCRDDKDELFNRHAWGCIYNLIHYHHGVLSHLKKSTNHTSQLASLLELIAPNNSGPIVIHGLRTLTKLFCMIDIDGRKNVGKSPKKIMKDSEKKAMEKDLKYICEFYAEREAANFQRQHMIYKRVTSSNVVSQKQYVELMQFYHIIGWSPLCSKIRRAVDGNRDYKAGMAHVQAMFAGDPSVYTGVEMPSAMDRVNPLLSKGRANLSTSISSFFSYSPEIPLKTRMGQKQKKPAAESAILIGWVTLTMIFLSSRGSPIISNTKHPELDTDMVIEQRSALLKKAYGQDPHIMECLSLDHPSIVKRYGYLRERWMNIMLGGNTFNTEPLLPTQIKAISDLVLFLHRNTSFGISVHESGSKDKTGQVLTDVLVPLAKIMNISHSEIFVTASKEGPDWGKDPDQRIPILVELRNLVISPLWKTTVQYDMLLFFNDIYYCVDDLLELIHQHIKQSADITCAFDWHPHYPKKFYDTWVARDLVGNMIWEHNMPHFGYHPPSQRRYEQRLPIQVYSCWNGMLVFAASPFVKDVKFRNPNTTKGECRESESTRICKDYWKVGRGRVQVIPSVGVAYAEDKYLTARREWQHPSIKPEDSEEIQWIGPPEKVRCIPKYGHDYRWSSTEFLPDHL